VIIQVDVNELLSFVVSACTSFTTIQNGRVCQWIDFVQKTVWILRTDEIMQGYTCRLSRTSLRRWCGTSKMTLASLGNENILQKWSKKGTIISLVEWIKFSVFDDLFMLIGRLD
jgi:hypothetical protein